MSDELKRLVDLVVNETPNYCLGGMLYHNTDIYRLVDLAYYCVMNDEHVDIDLLQSKFADKLGLEGEARDYFYENKREIIGQLQDLQIVLDYLKDKKLLK